MFSKLFSREKEKRTWSKDEFQKMVAHHRPQERFCRYMGVFDTGLYHPEILYKSNGTGSRKAAKRYVELTEDYFKHIESKETEVGEIHIFECNNGPWPVRFGLAIAGARTVDEGIEIVPFKDAEGLYFIFQSGFVGYELPADTIEALQEILSVSLFSIASDGGYVLTSTFFGPLEPDDAGWHLLLHLWSHDLNQTAILLAQHAE